MRFKAASQFEFSLCKFAVNQRLPCLFLHTVSNYASVFVLILFLFLFCNLGFIFMVLAITDTGCNNISLST